MFSKLALRLRLLSAQAPPVLWGAEVSSSGDAGPSSPAAGETLQAQRVSSVDGRRSPVRKWTLPFASPVVPARAAADAAARPDPHAPSGTHAQDEGPSSSMRTKRSPPQPLYRWEQRGMYRRERTASVVTVGSQPEVRWCAATRRQRWGAHNGRRSLTSKSKSRSSCSWCSARTISRSSR